VSVLSEISSGNNSSTSCAMTPRDFLSFAFQVNLTPFSCLIKSVASVITSISFFKLISEVEFTLVADNVPSDAL
jgi:hypothetical protein